MKTIFWCEFPDKVNLKLLNEILNRLDLNIDIYIASKDLKEFHNYKEKFSKIKNIKIIGCWPILSKNKGYWYSGFTDLEFLKSLLEYKNLKIKIDIEPPMEFESFYFIKNLLWLMKYLMFKSKNKEELSIVLNQLGKKNLIISTFPLPKILINRLINIKDLKNCNLNLMYYSSLMPKGLKYIYRIYFKSILKQYKRISNVMIAVGLISKGIFGNEPVYKNIKEFKKDLEFVRSLRINTIVIFELSGVLKKDNAKEWFKCL